MVVWKILVAVVFETVAVFCAVDIGATVVVDLCEGITVLIPCSDVCSCGIDVDVVKGSAVVVVFAAERDVV